MAEPHIQELRQLRRENRQGQHATVIGEVTERHPGMVVAKTMPHPKKPRLVPSDLSIYTIRT